jgi:ribosomal protein L9
MRLKEIIESWENYTTTPKQKFLRAKAKEIEQVSVTIEVPAYHSGRLHQPLSPLTVIPALIKQCDIQMEHAVVIHEEIEELGLYNVFISLGEGVNASLKTWVVPQTEDS